MDGKGSVVALDPAPAQSHKLFVPKCLCLVSHWPFFSQFNRFLAHLYKAATHGDLTVPVERVVANFVLEVGQPPAPLPVLRRPSPSLCLRMFAPSCAVLLCRVADPAAPSRSAGGGGALLRPGQLQPDLPPTAAQQNAAQRFSAVCPTDIPPC